MTHATKRTPEQTRSHYLSQMGEDLGGVFYALWQEVAWLHNEWHEYLQLFGMKPTRITLMNNAAPQFFRMIQDELLDMIVLRIARLTDSPKSAGKSNLTIQQLLCRINDKSFRNVVANLIGAAVAAAKFCRERRHRLIAHRALDLSLSVGTETLPDLTRQNIAAAIESLSKVLNAVSFHYLHSTTEFGLVSNLGGALALIRILDDGVQKRAERMASLNRGEDRMTMSVGRIFEIHNLTTHFVIKGGVKNCKLRHAYLHNGSGFINVKDANELYRWMRLRRDSLRMQR